MENRSFYNEILTEHNIRPEFKHDLPDANIVLEGVNPNCGDDIWLKLKVENGIIEDGAFVGDGCAQWCPARTSIPSAAMISLTSCGCTLSIVNATIPVWFAGSSEPIT